MTIVISCGDSPGDSGADGGAFGVGIQALGNARTYDSPSGLRKRRRGRDRLITINEGLAWLQTLKKRHEELLALRNDNAHRERRFYGASADWELVKEPVLPGCGPLVFPASLVRPPHRPGLAGVSWDTLRNGHGAGET